MNSVKVMIWTQETKYFSHQTQKRIIRKWLKTFFFGDCLAQVFELWATLSDALPSVTLHKILLWLAPTGTYWYLLSLNDQIHKRAQDNYYTTNSETKKPSCYERLITKVELLSDIHHCRSRFDKTFPHYITKQFCRWVPF